MLPWSVTARLSMPSFLTCATSSGIRLAPSSNEYSLWVWRWTKGMCVGVGRSRLAPIACAYSLLSSSTRRPAGHREPAAAPRDDRGDRPPRTRDARAPPHSPPRRLRPPPRPPSARSWRHAAVEQLDGVRALGPLRARRGDRRGQPAQQVAAGILPGRRSGRPAPTAGREAGAAAGVAGGPGLLHPVQDRVAVAVEPDLPDHLLVAGRLALAPEGARGTGCSSGPAPWPRSAPARPGWHRRPSGRRRNGSPGPPPGTSPSAPNRTADQPVVLGHRREGTGTSDDCQKPLWLLILLPIPSPFHAPVRSSRP